MGFRHTKGNRWVDVYPYLRDLTNGEYTKELRCISPSYWTAKNLTTVRRRSKEMELKCDLDVEYLLKLQGYTQEDIWDKDREVCPILDNKYIFNKKSRFNKSLDRIEPHLGYVKGNVRYMSALANMIISQSTPEDTLSVALYRLQKDWHLIEDHTKVFLLKREIERVM